MDIDPDITKHHLVETDLWVSKGDEVKVFNAANDAIGTLVLRFDSQEELNEKMKTANNLVKVLIN